MPVLFAEQPNEGPAWVAGTLAAVGVAYAVFKFLFWLLGKRRSYRQEIRRGENELQRTVDEQKAARRREAAAEAWEVVDRLNAIVEGHSAKIRELEERHELALVAANARTEECREEHAEAQRQLGEMRGYVSVIAAWGRTKGLKIPPIPGGTDTHQALPSEDVQ